MNTGGHQGEDVDDTILFILLALSYTVGRIGNEDGKSGKRKNGARPFAVLKNNFRIQAKMTSRFDQFIKREGDCIAAWQVQLDPKIHTKGILLRALDDEKYQSILRQVKGEKWNDEALRTRIDGEKNLKGGVPLPNLPLGNPLSSSNGSNGTGRLPESPVEMKRSVTSPIFLNLNPGAVDGEGIPDLSLPSPPQQSLHDSGVYKCIVACISLYMST